MGLLSKICWIAGFVGGRTGKSCQKCARHLRETLPVAHLLHQVWRGFSPWANSAWIPEDQALPCLKFIKGSLQFIPG